MIPTAYLLIGGAAAAGVAYIYLRDEGGEDEMYEAGGPPSTQRPVFAMSAAPTADVLEGLGVGSGAPRTPIPSWTRGGLVHDVPPGPKPTGPFTQPPSAHIVVGGKK